MADNKKTVSQQQRRKRTRGKSAQVLDAPVPGEDAAQRHPGPSAKDASRSGAPEQTSNQRGKTAPESTTVGESSAPRALAVIPLHVRWRDLDAFNHVNNSSYLTFLEESRLQWLRTVPGEWFNEHSMPVMAAVELHYRKPITWPAEIDVMLSCERLGNSSMTIGNRIVARGDGECVFADGNIVMVWVDPASGASVPLPDAIRNACTV